ncbi:MAG: aminopeptidase [Candidatus Diapherotrites archaeon]|nr:aminopeptidase [Candidatus Diapherotrites archaeon]
MLNGKPVGIATLVVSKRFGLVTNIAVLQEHRGKNLGSAMSLNTVSEAIEKKADIIFLQTEHKSTNEKFYKKLGFSTKFLGTAFALDKLAYGAKQAVNVCVKVKPGDKIIVITDNKTKNAADLVIKEIKKVTENLEVLVLEDYGKRPFQVPDVILEKLKNSDAVFVIADYVFGEIPTFYRPLNECVEKNKLIMASMVELNKQLLSEGMNADYEKIREFSKQVFNAVKDSKEIQVTTELGTDFSLKCRHNWAILDGFPTPGKWVNLPDGEVLTAPTGLNGKIVIDGVAEFLGVLTKNPLTVEIKNNVAQKNSIYCSDKKTEEKFIKLVFGSDKNSSKIGEFAFGTNLFLKKLCGNLTQDEKFPSVHVAFGDPHGSLTGTKWKSKLHMDAIILKPTVFADGKKIIKKGKYTL